MTLFADADVPPACLARRRILRFAMAALGTTETCLARAADTPSPTPAGETWHKFTKKVAGYVDKGRGPPEVCGMCHYFLDPDQCVLVEGPITPRGWCNYGVTTG